MSQLGELLNKLAISGGIDAEDEGLKALLSNPTASTIDVPENIATAITGNLLTLESAKQNPTLKNHFTALALAGVDSELTNLQTKYGFEQSDVDELSNEKSSYKRMGLMLDKIKALEGAKANNNKAGNEVLQAEIDKLNGELLGIKESHTSEISNLNNTNRANIKTMLINSVLNGYDYSLPTSKEVSVSTANELLKGELEKQGAQVVLTDNNNLALQTKEGTEFYLQNEKVSFKGLVDGMLANHKLLKTKEAPATPPPPTVAPGTTPATPGGNAFLQQATEDARQFETE